MRILIADDHPAVRKGICAILESRSDVEVCGEAANGKEAVEMVLEFKPDLVILDITMPVLDGFGAAWEIKKSRPDLPILFFSMHSSRQLIEEAKSLGVQGLVAKGATATNLFNAIDAILRKETFFHQFTT